MSEAEQSNDQWGAPSPLDKRFWDFHKSNPNIYSELVKLSQQVKDSGRKRISINMMFEVIRWNSYIKTTTKDFKLNNSYRSRYARIIVENNPQFVGMFEVRRIKS